MAGAIDEDTARSIARGRDAVGGVLSGAQSELKKVFLVFLVALLGTIWALRAFVWDALERDLLREQMSEEVNQAVEIVAVTPFDVILLQIKIGLVVGILVTIPVLVWVSRGALRRRGFWPSEHIPRWKVLGVLVLVAALFVGGVFYAYELFFPLMFEFLASNAVNAGFTPTYSIVMWTEFIALLGLSFGLAAQLPLAMSATASAGIVRYETFRDKWRYAVVGIFVFGAVFSPPDPFTQIMWAVPLVSLYAVSLGITKLVVLGKRAGEHVPVRGVVTDRWNVLAGTLVLVGGAVYGYLTRGGLSATNDLLATVGSSYRFPVAGDLSLFGLAPSATAAVYAGIVALVGGAVALFYLRIKALETVAADTALDAGPAPASVGEPAEIDIDALSPAAVKAAPIEAFVALSEDEALAHARRAMDDDEPEKAELILERYDEALEADLEDEAADEEEHGVVTSTTAGMVDAFSEDETTEEDIGGYYYDIAFIVDSLTSKAIWLVATFAIVMAATFVYLYSGGIGDIQESFVGGLPDNLVAQFDIVTLHPVEALIFEVKFSVLLGAVAVLPLVAYFAWPAIEERGITTGNRNTLLVWGGTVIATLVLGSLLGFFYIAPTIISWLAYDALTSHMMIAYRINNFGWLVIFTTVGVGILAEIPVTMVLFHRGNIVSYDRMRRHWRVFVLAVFALAAFFTPKGIFTMFIVAIPAAFAYAIGLGVLWLYTRAGGLRSRPSGRSAD